MHTRVFDLGLKCVTSDAINFLLFNSFFFIFVSGQVIQPFTAAISISVEFTALYVELIVYYLQMSSLLNVLLPHYLPYFLWSFL